MVSERKKERDPLGVEMKELEKVFTSPRLNTDNHIVARLDGRGFSKFTKKMNQPYDIRLSKTMRDVTEALMEEFKADVGYTQSDEISLVWRPKDNPESQFIFDGKIQKINSVLAGFCSSAFVMKYYENFGRMPDRIPGFDCRIIDMTHNNADRMLIWRRMDARRNAIQMVGRTHFSHDELHKKPAYEILDMLYSIGINFMDFPEFFKYGTTYTRGTRFVELTKEELERIPEKNRPIGAVERTVITPDHPLIDITVEAV